MGVVGAIKRRWKLWALGGVAVVLLMVVGGPFVYIHFVEGKAPAPLALSNSTATAGSDGPTTVVGPSATTGSSGSGGSGGSGGSSTTVASGAPVAVAGTWNVASGSQVGYRIKETLFGQSNTAVGQTTSVTGSILITGTTVTSGSFSVDMTTVSSDQSRRDDQFNGRIMDISTYPTATFGLTKPLPLGTLPGDGVVVAESATGDLNMHGVTKTVTFQVSAKRSGASIQVSGSIPIVFADWSISNPSGGPATTDDHGILEFLLNFSHH